MRTGSDYLASLDDGRRVWVNGEEIADVRTHRATAGVVQEHARWFDRHTDPDWESKLFVKNGKQQAVAFQRPTTVDILDRQMEAARAQAFASAGNITHPPQYGANIMLGAFDPVVSFGPKDRADAVTKFYDDVLATQRFVAAPYVSPIGDRFLPPQERLKPHVVEERDDGIVVSGTVGLGTGLCYAETLLTAPLPGPLTPEQALWFAFPIAAPGVKVLCRQPSARVDDSFLYPLSTNYDELDCTVFLDNVFVPWEAVFVYKDVEFCNTYMNHHVTWLVLMHFARMIARTEYTLGLALAVSDALEMGRNGGVLEIIVDLIIHLETMRASMRAGIAAASLTPSGVMAPDTLHIAAGTIYALQNRAKLADTVRTLGGFGGMLAPSLADLQDPDIGPHLERSYGGGKYTARQRAAMLHLLRDHTASAMDAREAAFEALASAGLHTWRLRTRMAFTRYEELANAVTAPIRSENPPHVDMSFMTTFDPLTRS
jgi:4-hydroxyphenylacetate 3-monooxygenase